VNCSRRVGRKKLVCILIGSASSRVLRELRGERPGVALPDEQDRDDGCESRDSRSHPPECCYAVSWSRPEAAI
jgi:hypothetical protein